MKVGIVNKEMIELYNDHGYKFDLVKLDNYDDLSGLDSVVAGRLSNEQIDSADRLKHIFIPFTGMNGFDVEYVKSKGIVFHTSTIHSKFVAERALALVLTLLGKITYYDSEMKKNRWGDRNFSTRVSWSSLSDKRVGIYGYGNIGKFLHSYISPFTDKVVVYSRTLKDNVTNVASLEELFDLADIIFVCVPLTGETEGSINSNIISRSKDKIIVNVARGKVVEEEALYNGLLNKNLSGYASDVWYNYPTRDNPEIQPSKYDLSKFNVIMTPHCGGFADNSQELRYIETLNNISKQKG